MQTHLATVDDDTDVMGSVIHLFTNDVAPLTGNTRAIYDECDFPGYRSVEVASMIRDADPLADELRAEWTLQSDLAHPLPITGFFVTVAGKVIHAESLPTSYIGVVGDVLTIGFPIVR